MIKTRECFPAGIKGHDIHAEYLRIERAGRGDVTNFQYEMIYSVDSHRFPGR
jgi:hypothetical protein